MSIRLKIVLIVLPLLVATLALTGVSSYFSASNGVSRVARTFLAFKASQVRKHAESQWTLLVENGLTGREVVAALAAAKNADYLTVRLGGVERVGKGFWFEPFGWYVLVTEERAAFY